MAAPLSEARARLQKLWNHVNAFGGTYAPGDRVGKRTYEQVEEALDEIEAIEALLRAAEDAQAREETAA